ncbi:ABC-type proline/glycine betaine transport system ATPase subunit [Breznakia sp. PF5-3]|nr:ABC-type proline/glycine betaine transport system ATPase subunit [Breznakia sp. PM6-1]MDF9835299.1 ABC-type proline/glycine betaine transport system ATPase subunit [Breznakia sp. PF5-3]MDF9837015.1 ABC-type proline/glycine betaine transport system ATPase subunit [Breznakia sp. PFB2-8]MDF9858940.1 ABC-type proline/glycine betaine transport system ATPase subunit [Breznakia sp. PH5-24]
MNNHDIIRVESISKVFKMNKTAQKLIDKKESKDIIYEKSGAIVALQDVSFNVKRGETFCIIGLSGSGKSTLIRCLIELVKPTSGKIYMNDIDVLSLSKKELLEFRR